MHAKSLGFRQGFTHTHRCPLEGVALDLHLALRVQGLGEREMDKDMVNVGVGVRRQSRSPPNIAMSSLIQRGVRKQSHRPPQPFLQVSIGG